MTRYLFFVLLPYLVVGVFLFIVGVMHGQSNFAPRDFDLGDAFNLFAGGIPAACIGGVIEWLTRKKDKEPKQREAEEVLEEV